ncbi:unnamed protein product [Anisakis simplex]|uniref:Geminin n=1 Tax=Anisakis simplex TaxID=6269 RepID=A0A0M3K4F9_ANISI|nr:unnamed protein product [Anisakis simplex]
MATVRKALYTINADPKSLSPEGKDSLKQFSKQRAKVQLRVKDVNRDISQSMVSNGKLNKAECKQTKNNRVEMPQFMKKNSSVKDEQPKKQVSGCNEAKLHKNEGNFEQSKSDLKSFPTKTNGWKQQKEGTDHKDNSVTGLKNKEIIKNDRERNKEFDYKEHHCINEKSVFIEEEARIFSNAEVQTDVTVSECPPKITAADLISETPSASYWRSLANKLECQLDQEFFENLRLNTDLGELRRQIDEIERETEEVIEFVKSAIAEGQSTLATANE